MTQNKEALDALNTLDGWISDLKGMMQEPIEIVVLNIPSINADIDCAIKSLRKHGATIRSALTSEAVTVPVIEGLDAAINKIAGWGNQDWDCSLNPSQDVLMKAARWVSENAGNHIADSGKMVVPEGYALVPIAPTMEMYKAGKKGLYEARIV